MNLRADFTNLGGFPLEQDTLNFMQQSYRGALAAMANMCGTKTILYGVQLAAGSYSNGWISYNGELMPFIGAVAAADVVITDLPATVPAVFEDGAVRNVYFTKTATCGSAGLFPMADLIPIKKLSDLTTDLAAAMAKLAQINGIVTHVVTDVAVGDIVNDKFIDIVIPNQGGVNYVVSGTLVGYSANPDADNDVAWMIAQKTPTSFRLCVKDINAPANVQNLKFDFTITKAI